jgi:fucose permease
LGVALLFLANAVAYADVVPRLPELRDELGLSNAALGTAIAAMPAGALLCGLAVGPLVARWSSARASQAGAVGIAVALPLVALAPSWGALAVAFALFGASDALMDAAMNTHGLRVQRAYPHSIVTAMHGLWSVGAVAGGLAGSVAAGAHLGLGTHLVAVAAVVLGLVAVATPLLLTGPDDALDAPAPGEARVRVPWRVVAVALAAPAVLVVASGVVEDAPGSWGAVLLHDELGTSAGLAGSAFVAFQLAMVTGRFVGDRLLDRWGAASVLRWGALAGAVAVTGALAIGEAWAVAAGFAVAGVGMASVFPVAFRAAGEVPGLRPGVGVGLLAWVGRVGFLLAPPVVGALADAATVRGALLAMPVAGVVAALAAGRLATPVSPPPAQALRVSSGSSASTR